MIFAGKDGGPLSKVSGFFLESKKVGSAVLLRFEPGTREAFHTHAFNAWSLILGPGRLEETFFGEATPRVHKPGTVLHTAKEDFHQVRSVGTTYVLTFRGPWEDLWQEVDEDGNLLVLTHGRKVVAKTYWGKRVGKIITS